MIKFLFLLFVTASTTIFGVYWLSNNSGEMQFVVLDSKIETTVTVFVVALIASIVLLQIIISILTKLFNLPINIKRYFKEKKLHDNISYLSKYISSYAMDEVSDARKYIRNVDKNLVEDNLVTIAEMLLDKKSNDKKTFKNRLLTLTKNKNTSLSAYLELVKISNEEEDWIKSISYAQEIWKEEKSPNVAKQFFRAMIKLGRWDELLSILDKSRLITMFHKDFSSYLTSDEHKNILTYVKYNLASKYAKDHENIKAIELLEKVMTALPKFTLAYEMASNIFISEKKYDNAIKIVKRAWKYKPTSNLCGIAIEAVKSVNEGQVEKVYSSLKSIANMNSHDYESNILLSLGALESERYDIASKHITEALSNEHKQRACILMAEYCQRTHGNKAEAIRWLRDAIKSQSDQTSEDYFWDEDCFAITPFICHKISKI